MKYVSTRNNQKEFNFKEVFIKGLADDGGLFVPKSLKKFTEEEINNLIYEKEKVITDFDKKIINRYNFLTEYQNTKYADQYKELVDYVKKYEQKIKIDKNNFSNAVAINYFKLMSYKDEYEVARLYSNNEFINKINKTFEGNFKINFHLAPPIFYKKDKVTGNPLKMHFGSWIMVLFKFIGIFKFLRGTFISAVRPSRINPFLFSTRASTL